MHFHDNTSSKRNSPNCDPPAKLSNNNNMTHVYITHIVPKRETQMTTQQNWVVSFSYKGGQGKYTPFHLNVAHPQILSFHLG